MNLGELTSSMKDAVLAFGANMAAVGHAMAGDEVLKNAFASTGLEAYEIATYKSLLRMADTADPRAIETLKQSLGDEERMAEWLADNVDRITLEYMGKSETVRRQVI